MFTLFFLFDMPDFTRVWEFVADFSSAACAGFFSNNRVVVVDGEGFIGFVVMRIDRRDLTA